MGELPPGCGQSGVNFVFDPDLIDKPQVEAAIKLMCKSAGRKKSVITRILKSTRKGKTKTCSAAEEGTITFVKNVDGQQQKQSQSYKKSEMDKVVPDILGVSPAILNNVIFCHQEESNWPLTEGAQLKQKFDDIFESSRYTEALKSMRTTKKLLEDKAKEAAHAVDVEKVKLGELVRIKQGLQNRGQVSFLWFSRMMFFFVNILPFCTGPFEQSKRS